MALRRNVLFAATIAAMVPLAACLPEERQQPPPSNRQTQNQAAAQAAAQVRFTGNAEIENIRRRLELTADPTLLGYIVLFNEAGAPIMYEGVRGKVTTSGSRLTAPDIIVRRPGGQSADSQAVIRAPSDTGTYDVGAGAPFIFYWNTNGEYRQWAGPYLYSDKPIRMRVEPLVISVAPPAPPAQ